MKISRLITPIVGLIGILGIGVATPSHPAVPGQQAQVQAPSSEATLGIWEKQLALPPHVTARLAWAQKSLAPSGVRKLERLAFGTAASIASGTDFAALQKQAEMNAVVAFAGLSGMDVSATAFIVLAMATKDMDDDIRLILVEIKAMNQAKQRVRDLIKELNDWISQEMSKASQRTKTSDLENSVTSGSKPSVYGKPQPERAAFARGIILKKTVSPIIHLEYVKAPVVPPLPPRNSGDTIQGLRSLLGEFKGKLDSMNEMSEMTFQRLRMIMDYRLKFISKLSSPMEKMSTTQGTLVQNIK